MTLNLFSWQTFWTFHNTVNNVPIRQWCRYVSDTFKSQRTQWTHYPCAQGRHRIWSLLMTLCERPVRMQIMIKGNLPAADSTQRAGLATTQFWGPRPDRSFLNCSFHHLPATITRQLDSVMRVLTFKYINGSLYNSSLRCYPCAFLQASRFHPVFVMNSGWQNQTPTDFHFPEAAADVPVFCFQNWDLIRFFICLIFR